jgi:Family of unknown function (DUF6131)
MVSELSVASPSRTYPCGSMTGTDPLEVHLIILGVVLLIIGFIAKIAIVWTIGIVVVVVGAILALLGMTDRAVGGRRHYF